MAYGCPRCGEDVSRGYSGGAQAAAGLGGALFYAAFGAFECKKYGRKYTIGNDASVEFWSNQT